MATEAESLHQRLKRTFHDITGSIAFYPTLMSLGFFIFALLIMSIEYTDIFMQLKQYISIVLVNGVDNARLILNTLIGGIISLTVFSFSMVMIVLNRATATLSPRVIPGLITRKSHQFVLGFYLGTIIYSLMLTINLNSPEIEASVPKLGILISFCFGIACLALFVYFIHSISRTIQVDNILNQLYQNTLKEMKKLQQKTDEQDNSLIKENGVPEWGEGHIISSVNTGYFKTVEVSGLMELLEEHDLKVRVRVPHGFFVVEEYPFLEVDRQIEDEELRKAIQKPFIFFVEEYVEDHYTYGFKQISEIAIKALSPGINDPGTAVKAVDLLTMLIRYRIENDCRQFETDSEGEVRLIYESQSLDELLFRTLTPIRNYGKDDILVVLNLLECLKNCMYARVNDDQLKVLVKHAEGIMANGREAKFNKEEVRRIDEMVSRMNELLPEELKLQSYHSLYSE